MIGGLSGFRVEGFDIIPAIVRKARLKSINVGSRDMFEAMNFAIEHSELHPIVDSVYPFERAVDALQYLTKGSYFGKVVISFKQ